MEENIEVKDVQKTEYLDKNGLDMLWAKVKENTHNQVEVERNRAVAKEDSIVQQFDNLKYVPYISKEFNEYTLAEGATIKLQDLAINAGSFVRLGQITRFDSGDSHVEITSSQIAVCYNPSLNEPDKFRININSDGIWSSDNNANHVFATDGSIADLTQYAKKSEIADKVDTTALTALEEKVTANTTAIEGKQDAGNYIPYNMLAFKNKYVIEPSYSIEFRTDALNNKYGKAFIGPQIISITSASGQNTAVEPEEISIKQSGNASGRIHSTLNVDSFGVYNNNDDSVIFKLNQYGIKLEDGDDNHVLTSNASTIDIREYALKSVYDKKIASLEARIAALEAKHAETA